MTEESPPLRITQRAPAYSLQELLDKIILKVTARKQHAPTDKAQVCFGAILQLHKIKAEELLIQGYCTPYSIVFVEKIPHPQ